MELEKITERVLRGRTMESQMEKSDWKDFEKTVGDIFRQNDFRVRNNFRFKTRRRYENDLIAIRSDLAFCVDCMRWSSGRNKFWGLVKAAGEQERRTKELKKFMKSNPIASSIMKVSDEAFVPLLVTLHQESVLKEGRTFVVPVKKLNAFILNFHDLI